MCVGFEFACTFFCALGDGGGYFKLHIGIVKLRAQISGGGGFFFNISAIQESNEKKNIHGSCNFLKGDGGGGGGVGVQERGRGQF